MARMWAWMAALLLIPTAAVAAQDDGAALKKKILEEVEKKLRAEEGRILKEIEKIIDQELRKAAERKADPTPSRLGPGRPNRKSRKAARSSASGPKITTAGSRESWRSSRSRAASSCGRSSRRAPLKRPA